MLRANERFKLKSKQPDGTEIVKEVGLMDLPYDAGSLGAAGSMCGSEAIIVLDESADMVAALGQH